MYDELVNALRVCADGEHCSKCSKWELKLNAGRNACEYAICTEAADAIEELSKLHETQKKNLSVLTDAYMKSWIPVTERLPKEGEFVLVHGNLYPNKHDGGVIAVSKRMDWNYWQGFGRERNITHWMPLPEPPKEE